MPASNAHRAQKQLTARKLALAEIGIAPTAPNTPIRKRPLKRRSTYARQKALANDPSDDELAAEADIETDMEIDLSSDSEVDNNKEEANQPDSTTAQSGQQQQRTSGVAASPQKSARPASKEDSGLQLELLKGLQQVKTQLQQSKEALPTYSFYQGLLQALDNAMQEIQHPAAAAANKKPTYSAVTMAGIQKPATQRQPNSLASSSWATVGPKTTKHKGPKPKETQPTRSSQQVILKLKRDQQQQQPRKVESLALRNKMNNALGITAIAITADQLLAKQADWISFFHAYPVESADTPITWTKLVAHGVPVCEETDALSIFQQEAETYNPIKVMGAPRWLKKPRPDQLAGSVVFAVPTADQGAYSQKNGLYIAGVRAKVVAYKTFNSKTQCHRCQGFGHDPTTCSRQARCAICAKPHLTRVHKCPKCNASERCEHIELSCINCKGKHQANSPSCEVHSAIRL